MITINQKITRENHWLLFMAAESLRKSQSEFIQIKNTDIQEFFRNCYIYGELPYLPEALYIECVQNYNVINTFDVFLTKNSQASKNLNCILTKDRMFLPEGIIVDGDLILYDSCFSSLKELKIPESMFIKGDIRLGYSISNFGIERIKVRNEKFKEKFTR